MTFLWEFGDGHFALGKEPRYCYAEPGEYEVRVTITPYYSYDPSRIISRNITIDRSCNEHRSYQSVSSKWVGVSTSANHELVPGHTITVVLEYKTPHGKPSTGGYLLFLHNDQRELESLDLKFDPLVYQYNTERLFQASKMNSPFPDEWTGISPTTKDYVYSLLDDYEVEAFECDLQPGKDNRVFLSITAASALDTNVIRGKKGKLEVSIVAVWIPRNRTFDADLMVDVHKLEILSVHDPNKLSITKPRNVAYYHPRKSEELEFRIDFQNLGGRPVKQVDIIVPWNENLDYRTINVVSSDPDQKSCPPCPPDFIPGQSSQSCLKLDTSMTRLNDSVTFRFHNISLHGKNEPGLGGGKYTKGHVTYRVKSNKKTVDKTSSRAQIVFLGGDPLVTGYDHKKWRHKSIGLKLGRNYNARLNGFDSVEEELMHWYNIGVFFKNAPVRTGIGYGAELSSAGFAFRAWDVDATNRSIDDIRLTQERIDLKTLDMLFHTEVRFRGLIVAGIGGGLSIPVIGKGELTYRRPNYVYLTDEHMMYLADSSGITPEAFDELFAVPGDSLEATSNFGIFSSREEVNFAGLTLKSGPSLGGMVHSYVEAGLLRSIALGLRYDFRIYPKLYKQECAKIRNAEVYLRVKLWSLK